jgi:hypothetical protein
MLIAIEAIRTSLAVEVALANLVTADIAPRVSGTAPSESS